MLPQALTGDFWGGGGWLARDHRVLLNIGSGLVFCWNLPGHLDHFEFVRGIVSF
jgi:hypothetical protein